LKYYDEYGVASENLVINYRKIYSDALARVVKLQNALDKNKSKSR